MSVCAEHTLLCTQAPDSFMCRTKGFSRTLQSEYTWKSDSVRVRCDKVCLRLTRNFRFKDLDTVELSEPDPDTLPLPWLLSLSRPARLCLMLCFHFCTCHCCTCYNTFLLLCFNRRGIIAIECPSAYSESWCSELIPVFSLTACSH